MPDLVLHDQPIPTVFDLLGHDENDMTASLGWALAHNPALLDRFVERVAPGVSLTEPPAIELQKHDRTDGGFTDIELLAPELHVIVEAKIGWNPPSEVQLHRDEDPFAKTSARRSAWSCSPRTAPSASFRHRLGAWAPGPSIILAVVGWSDLVSMATLAEQLAGALEVHLVGSALCLPCPVPDVRRAL